MSAPLFGCSSRPKPGEQECGDRWVVVPHADGLLVGVADGLGHGPLAAAAAAAACCHLERARPTDPLDEVLRGCDHAIAGTRGAAVTVCFVDACQGRLRHAAVGNVELQALSAQPIRPIAMPGVVGGGFRRAMETSFPLHPGDLLVLFTDGVSSRMALERYRHRDPQAAAEGILQDWAKDHDDATCVVVLC